MSVIHVPVAWILNKVTKFLKNQVDLIVLSKLCATGSSIIHVIYNTKKNQKNENQKKIDAHNKGVIC